MDTIFVQQLLKTASASQISSNPGSASHRRRPHLCHRRIYRYQRHLETGHLNDWSVNLGSNVALQIQSINFLSEPGVRQRRPNSVDRLAVNSSTDTVISAWYDTVNRDIVLNNVVNGSGGSVYLSGRDHQYGPGTATNPLGGYGNIVVNSGYSDVTIDNTTGWPVVVKTINTGQSTPSVVQIVDTDKIQNNGLPLSMFYVYGQRRERDPSYQGTGSANTDYTKATWSGPSTALRRPISRRTCSISGRRPRTSAGAWTATVRANGMTIRFPNWVFNYRTRWIPRTL